MTTSEWKSLLRLSTSACSSGVRVLDSLIGEGFAGAESLNQFHSLVYKAVKSDSSMHLSAVTGGQRCSLALFIKCLGVLNWYNLLCDLGK